MVEQKHNVIILTFYIIKNTTTTNFQLLRRRQSPRDSVSDPLSALSPGSRGQKAAAPAQVLIIIQSFAKSLPFLFCSFNLFRGLKTSLPGKTESTWLFCSFHTFCLFQDMVRMPWWEEGGPAKASTKFSEWAWDANSHHQTRLTGTIIKVMDKMSVRNKHQTVKVNLCYSFPSHVLLISQSQFEFYFSHKNL